LYWSTKPRLVAKPFLAGMVSSRSVGPANAIRRRDRGAGGSARHHRPVYAAAPPPGESLSRGPSPRPDDPVEPGERSALASLSKTHHTTKHDLHPVRARGTECNRQLSPAPPLAVEHSAHRFQLLPALLAPGNATIASSSTITARPSAAGDLSQQQRSADSGATVARVDRRSGRLRRQVQILTSALYPIGGVFDPRGQPQPCARGVRRFRSLGGYCSASTTLGGTATNRVLPQLQSRAIAHRTTDSAAQ
jgi:hypothetical protein